MIIIKMIISFPHTFVFLVLLDEIKKKKIIGRSNLSNNSSKQLKGVDNYQ